LRIFAAKDFGSHLRCRQVSDLRKIASSAVKNLLSPIPHLRNLRALRFKKSSTFASPGKFIFICVYLRYPR